MTQNSTSFPTHLLTVTKSAFCKSVVVSILGLSSVTAVAWNGDASPFNVSNKVVRTSDPLLDFWDFFHALALHPRGEDREIVIFNFYELRRILSNIIRSIDSCDRVLEILNEYEQIQDNNGGYLNLSEFSDMQAKLESIPGL